MDTGLFQEDALTYSPHLFKHLSILTGSKAAHLNSNVTMEVENHLRFLHES